MTAPFVFMDLRTADVQASRDFYTRIFNDALSHAIDLGATLIRPREDLPAGSVAVIQEPGGATLALWQAATGATA